MRGWIMGSTTTGSVHGDQCEAGAVAQKTTRWECTHSFCLHMQRTVGQLVQVCSHGSNVHETMAGEAGAQRRHVRQCRQLAAYPPELNRLLAEAVRAWMIERAVQATPALANPLLDWMPDASVEHGYVEDDDPNVPLHCGIHA